MSRDIADSCVGSSLTLGLGPEALEGSGGVQGESADELVIVEDGEVVTAGEDEDVFAGV